jgi:hypothetical protein
VRSASLLTQTEEREQRIVKHSFLLTIAVAFAAARIVWSGHLPLWNPYHLCGIPWIGTLQGGTFYPFHVLYGFLPLNQALAVSGAIRSALAVLRNCLRWTRRIPHLSADDLRRKEPADCRSGVCVERPGG